MSRTLLALFVVASVAVVANCRPEEVCGEHAEWNPCGSACPTTCDKRTQITYCTMQCVPQCDCVSGYMRNGVGNCVKEDECETGSQDGEQDEGKDEEKEEEKRDVNEEEEEEENCGEKGEEKDEENKEEHDEEHDE